MDKNLNILTSKEIVEHNYQNYASKSVFSNRQYAPYS